MKSIKKRFLSIIMAAAMVVGIIPMGMLSVQAAPSPTTLFHYTFDHNPTSGDGDNLDEIDPSSAYTIDIDGGNGGDGYWDWFDYNHYWFTKSWAKGNVNGLIRNSNYNKNWKIIFNFHYGAKQSTYGNNGADDWNYALGLFSDGDPFGILLDGRIRHGGTVVNSSVYSFSTDKEYILTYTYHNGIFNIYVENVTDSVAETKVYSYNATNTTYQSILENIQGVSLGGWWHNFTDFTCKDLIAYSYQSNDDIDNHLKAQYFTTSKMTKNRAGSGDLTKVGSGVTWSNSDGVTFPSNRHEHENYFYTRTNSLLSNSDEITGFTFTFKAKNSQYIWIERIFDYNDSSDWASNSANGNSIALAPNLNADLVSLKYFYDDGNGGFTDAGWTDNNPAETIANEHQYAVVVQDGAISVYVDGTAVTKCDVNISASLINNLISNGKLYIGASMFSGDPDFIGSIKDFRIYDIALTSTQITSINADTIDKCVAEFEKRISKMATNGYTSMYTNISAAYECYKNAKAGTGNVASFQTALDNMQPFDEYTGTNVPSGTSYSPESDYYGNVIYSEGMGEDGAHEFSDNTEAVMKQGSGWVYGSHVYLYYPNTVLLYDGVTPARVPVNIGFINKEHLYSVYMDYFAEDLDDFNLAYSFWKGSDDSKTFKWPTSSSNTISTSTSNTTRYDAASTINEDYTVNGTNESRTTYRIHKNALEFSPVGGKTYKAYTCISSSDWLMSGQYDFFGVQHVVGELTNPDPDIVVINYKMLIDALKTASNSSEHKTWLSNMSSLYTEAGLEGIFAAFDSATSLDPNKGSTYFKHTYDYANEADAEIEEPMDAAALLCGEDIDDSVKLLNDIKLTSDLAKVRKLKESIDAYEEFMDELSGKPTNLKAAYDAYCKAVQYVDAYEYGDLSSDYLTEHSMDSFDTVKTNLDNAKAAIGSWTEPTVPTVNVRFPGDSSNISSTYQSNILNWGSVPGSYGTSKGTAFGFVTWRHILANDDWALKIAPSNGASVSVTYPETVLLYDGVHNLKLPVFASTYRNNKSNSRYLWYLYPTDATNSKTKSSFQMDQKWKGTTYDECDWGDSATTAPFSFNSVINYNGSSNITNDSSADGWVSSNLIQGKHTSNDNWQYCAIAGNSMSYTGNCSEFGAGNYYKEYTLPWVGYLGDSFNDNTANNYSWATSSKSIYIINYSPIRNALISLSINGIDVSQYREGGLSTWFNQIEALESVNFNSYNYSSGESYGGSTGTLGAVKKCSAAISSAVSTAFGMSSSIPSGVNDSKLAEPKAGGVLINYSDATKEYQKLKIAILKAKAAQENQECVKSSVWTTYQTRLTAAINAATAIASSGYTASVTTIADNLNTSVDGLKELSNNEHSLKFSYRDALTGNLVFQCDTNNAHELTNAHSTTVSVDPTGYDALERVYNSIDRTKYADYSSIESAKETYDNVLKEAAAPGTTAQDYVDSGISALLTAINDKEQAAEDLNNFDVTFNVYTVNGKGVASNSPAYTTTNSSIRYGSTISYTPTSTEALSALASSGITDDNIGIVKWELVTGTGVDTVTRIFTQKENSFSVFVQETATVNVYVTKLVPSAQVTIKNIVGNTAYAIDANDETTIEISKDSLGTIIIDGETYTVGDTLSYSITGWKLGGTTLADSTTSLSTTAGVLKSTYDVDAIVLTPIKTVKDDSTYDFTLDGVTVLEDQPYDKKVTITTSKPNAYAIVVINDKGEYVPVLYCQNDVYSYSFNTAIDIDFYTLIFDENGYYVDVDNDGFDEKDAITNKDTILLFNNRIPFVYSFIKMTGDVTGTDLTTGQQFGNKWTTFNAFTVNSSATAITEFGTLRATEILPEIIFNLDYVGTETIVKTANNSKLDYSNQYSYSLRTSNTTPRVVETRAYVKFKYNYSGSIVDAVAYGDICTSYYGIPEQQ